MILAHPPQHLERQSTKTTTPYNNISTSVFCGPNIATPPSSDIFNYPSDNTFYPYDLQPLDPAHYYSHPSSVIYPSAADTSSGSSRIQNSHNINNRPMQSDQIRRPSNWNQSPSQFTSSSTQNHERQLSLSSMGSAGPTSPFDQHSSLPQVILPSDSISETYYGGMPNLDGVYTNFQKSQASHDFLQPAFQHNYNLNNYNTNLYQQLMAAQQKQNGEVETMLPPEYAHSGRPSVASTTDSPATPSAGDDFEEQNRKNDFRPVPSVPKLDRTMSDIYNDELYSPSFSFTSAPSQPSQNAPQSPMPAGDIFSQRLQAANNQHLSASSHSSQANSQRGRSPFRQGSPLAPTSQQSFNSHVPTQVRLGSAAQLREKQKEEEYQRVLQQHAARSSPELTTPKTISPKDALLEYHETEEDAARPLFSQQQVQHYPMSKPALVKQEVPAEAEESSSQQSFASMATSRRESSSAYSNSSETTPRNNNVGLMFAPPAVPGVQIPQQYPFVPQQRQQAPSASTEQQFKVEGDNGMQRPMSTKADTGTYTCTYHGCTLRFETPAKLQKHKREGHRQSLPIGGGANAGDGQGSGGHGGSGMTSAALMRNSQAGPHKCERINPSTGKPCNTIFSRPYDLTRHEDTIHNARKQKVRCQLCTEEKTFSRNDALTRHMRVVHPEVDFMGKNRRRG